MIYYLKNFPIVIGAFLIFVSLNIIFLVPAIIIGIPSLFTNNKRFKHKTGQIISQLITSFTLATKWVAHIHYGNKIIYGIPATLDENKQYITISNHQSWLDTVIIFFAIMKDSPVVILFLKENLKYVPVFGQLALILNMIFVTRNPNKSKFQKESLTKAITYYKNNPANLVCFTEGTRFTEKKHKAVQSPFKNLLPPKYYGMYLALLLLSENVDSLIDFTLVYPYESPNIFKAAAGEMTLIHAEFRKVPIPERLLDPENQLEKDFCKEVKIWVNQLWHEKDERITHLKAHYASLKKSQQLG